MRRGKLIVLEGIDGSGKATQAALLVQHLRKEGKRVETMAFPRYRENTFGKLIAECLVGLHGNFVLVDPYIASVLYAGDRFEAKEKIESWLMTGKTVVLDRYVSSNQIHQGGKIRNAKKRQEFLSWLDHVEHTIFGLPRPDLVVYLHVPVKTSLKLIKNASQARKEKLGKRRDRTESNQEYLENARRAALTTLSSGQRWVTIDCVSGGDLRSKEDIHHELRAIVGKVLRK